jgi:hypothetical protein
VKVPGKVKKPESKPDKAPEPLTPGQVACRKAKACCTPKLGMNCRALAGVTDDEAACTAALEEFRAAWGKKAPKRCF